MLTAQLAKVIFGTPNGLATHCSEADISVQHILYAQELDMDAVGFLMMSHLASLERLAAETKGMESYDASCIYVVIQEGKTRIKPDACKRFG